MFFAMVHEVGHALYDHGRDPAQYGAPVGEPASLGIHESQSRLWENQVGRSEGFWRHFYPELEKEFPDTLNGVSAADFRRAMNRVSRTFIRTQSDEVTYNFHVMIRFDLETRMLAGDLDAKDLPAAWGEQYSRRLGITPKDDRTGCLQDMHWSDGLIGYFPTYTLGNIYSAQLFKAAERKLGPLNDAFARGEFSSLREWLNENVYRYGHQFSAARIIEKATGTLGNPSALIDSLRERYAS
jgi:carboxypeptidase Taq